MPWILLQILTYLRAGIFCTICSFYLPPSLWVAFFLQPSTYQILLFSLQWEKFFCFLWLAQTTLQLPSVQLIFSRLLCVHILNAENFFSSSVSRVSPSLLFVYTPHKPFSRNFLFLKTLSRFSHRSLFFVDNSNFCFYDSFYIRLSEF